MLTKKKLVQQGIFSHTFERPDCIFLVEQWTVAVLRHSLTRIKGTPSITDNGG